MKKSSGNTIMGISFGNNPEQQELIRLIRERDKHIIFCEGAAGTGKNFASIATALELINQHEYKHIIYTRNPVQLGESIGFLKGDADDKNEPYMGPLYDTIDAIVRNSEDDLNPNDLLSKIEVVPLAFMRGKTINDDTICIFDEAQNCSIATINAVLTRGSTYSKTIVLGSARQIDDYRLRKASTCDFMRCIEALKDLSYVGYTQLTKSMRSPWCAEIDDILTNLARQ